MLMLYMCTYMLQINPPTAYKVLTSDAKIHKINRDKHRRTKKKQKMRAQNI